jgi:IclR family acetate operon transcriptional repressor
MAQESKVTIESLSRGLDLLEILAERGSVKLAELVGLLGASRATVFRVVKTLQERGYVEHVQELHEYRLGPGAFIVGARSQTSAIVQLAVPAMTDLHERSGETVNLALFRGGRLVYVEIMEATHAMRMTGTVGEEAPLHATALGKATLSVLPEERARQFLGAEPFSSVTPKTRTGWVELLKDLRATRGRGYSVDLEEMDMGAACVGAAIRANDGEPVAAISVSGLAARFTAKERERIGRAVATWAGKISEDLGHEAPPAGATWT